MIQLKKKVLSFTIKLNVEKNLNGCCSQTQQRKYKERTFLEYNAFLLLLLLLSAKTAVAASFEPNTSIKTASRGIFVSLINCFEFQGSESHVTLGWFLLHPWFKIPFHHLMSILLLLSLCFVGVGLALPLYTISNDNCFAI